MKNNRKNGAKGTLDDNQGIISAFVDEFVIIIKIEEL
jgi:hypothetical protein